MKSRGGIFLLFSVVTVIVVSCWWKLWSVPTHPVALLRVVNTAGKPIVGAIIVPDGVRPKPGAYNGGHYLWRSAEWGLTNSPVATDADGFAHVPFPKYVFERIETGEISFAVSHPDYVSDRPFRKVATTPPAGAPWKEWLINLMDRLRHKTLVSQPKPVVLQQGAILKLVVRPDSPGPRDTPLHAQVMGEWSTDTNTWMRPAPGVLMTRRLIPGPQTVRALRFDTNGVAWFSPTIEFTAVPGPTNEVEVSFQRSLTVRGRLDDSVRRPVKHGRVIGHVSPGKPTSIQEPPAWHTWSPVSDDGTFELTSLPPGRLGVVALCDGFVSTNGTSQTGRTTPQMYDLDAEDLDLVVGMEPTVRLEVKVTDPAGKALPGAEITTGPNVSYEYWGSTILGSDCYDMGNLFRGLPSGRAAAWKARRADFFGITDSNGLAVLPNVPVYVRSFGLNHTQYVLPAIGPAGGQKRRYAEVALTAGTTNYASVQVERKNVTPIKHY